MGLYFVRHGQTAWNVRGKLQGKSDIALNETGRAQAVETREKLKHVHMDAIYCSPLLRAKETAQIINELWKLPIQCDERLMERSFGSMEGALRRDVPFDDLWAFSSASMFAGGEDTAHFYERVEGFLKEVLPYAEQQEILIVAHGGVSIPYQCFFEGYACVDNLSDLIIANCEVKHYASDRIQELVKG
ncbi:histidine phosphatase family protein [Erysipelotrichaceae bacterium AF15-26LB]|nr:histidine phosphatase family protein [[Clostridium] innocuum]RJV83643.1 histidine phosphatase family protein [Erysipelotrichaceae bacterium AF19-24AC]RJV83675.1 histidine phosphatase family protein [Erysipelotrichaceae bacterium AF15-26LB]